MTPPFGTFPKIHPFWKGSASLTSKCQRILEEMWRGEMIVNMFISLFADTLNSAIHRYHPLSDWLTDIQAFSHSHISRYIDISRSCYHNLDITISDITYIQSHANELGDVEEHAGEGRPGKDQVGWLFGHTIGKISWLVPKKINRYFFLNDIEHLSTSRNLC